MNVLKHIILSVVVFVATTDHSFAQSYSVTPDDTIEVSGTFEDLETLIISQLNTSSDTIHLKWEKVSSSVPLLWEATICDNSLCNTSLVDTGSMNPVFPGETGFLLVHMTAHINEGTAIIRYAFWDINAPSTRDTLTFIMKVYHATGIQENLQPHTIQISPNPSYQYLMVSTDAENGFLMQLYDMNGKEVYIKQSNQSTINIPTSMFANGNYYLCATINQQKFTQKIYIQH